MKTMNEKEEYKFAKWTRDTEASKVKFNCSYGTFDDGSAQTYWHFQFDGNIYVDDSGGNSSLVESIKDYFLWSSRRIKELEAKLALAKASSDLRNL
jgi:hypothetical protein